MSQQSEPDPMNGSDVMRAALLQVTSELEYEKNHALFLGYKVSEIDSNILSLEPDSADRLWWWWLVKRSHGVLARRMMQQPRENAGRHDCLEFVNLANTLCEAVCLTLEVDKDGNSQIFAQSFLEGQYNRANFTIFMERINQELTNSLNNPLVLESWQTIREDS